MDIFIDLTDLTDSLEEFLDRELSPMSWAGLAEGLIRESIEFMNATDLTGALDCLTDRLDRRGLRTLETQRFIDQFFEAYTRTFEKTSQTHDVIYDQRSNVAMLTPKPIRVQPDIDLSNLKEEYNHALERSDFLPERLRRAFEELSR